MDRKRQVSKKELLRGIPSVDELSRSEKGIRLVEKFGLELFVSTTRGVLTQVKEKIVSEQLTSNSDEIMREVAVLLDVRATPKLRSVLNLTGTVLHTNLGRSVLPKEAIDRVSVAMSESINLEYDIDTGKRGDRDKLVEESLSKLTGAEAVTLVNNNAAAVFLALSVLGYRKDVLVSRGELVEIGGEFRIPDIMKRAGAKLVEVGTTNRTHLRDFESALSKKSGAIMKVHTSNYTITGFTSSVPEKELATLANENQVPFINDLGSGTLIDLSRYGLPKELTVNESLEKGADLVTFSCDKLLGGPQCGVIAGRKDLVEKVKKNSLKRILRVDKMTVAALEAVLMLYDDPDKLTVRLPTLRMLTRKPDEIRKVSEKISPVFGKVLQTVARVEVIQCKSQIGSGALPVDR